MKLLLLEGVKRIQVTNKQLAVNGLSEKELLLRYRAGDQDAFREVVTRYKMSLYTFLRRVTGNLDVVEDIFQETFLQLYTSQDNFDMNHPLRPWLFTVAANKAKDALQKVHCQTVINRAPSPMRTISR